MADLSRALDRLMQLPASEAKKYAEQFVAGLREEDHNVAMPTTPDVIRTAVLGQVQRLPLDEVEESTEDSGLHEDRGGDVESELDDGEHE